MLGLKPHRRAARQAGYFLGPIAALALSACAGDASPGGGPGAGPGGGAGPGSGGNGAAGQQTTPPSSAPQVGLIGLRRLNRTEYSNTLRDLTGAQKDYTNTFPAENLSFGFDNIGEALTVQPLHVEAYQKNADDALSAFLARPATDPARSRILTCDPNSGRACVFSALLKFAQYAYRRPVAEAEVKSLAELAEDFVTTGGTWSDGLKLALKGVLLSPHFVYRVEQDPNPTSKEPHRLAPFELASRLSYFFWSTMPDEALFVEAQNAALAKDVGLAAQVERMLADPRSAALVSNFAGQWLNLRRTEQIMPDTAVFPGFDETLRSAMRTEGEMFFAELLREGRPVSELLTSSFTYVNQRLAQHYGLPAPAGSGFERVMLSGSPRLGLLSQASFLTITSNPTRTSPVKRGKWVLDQLLCSPPPPPPPNIDTNLVEMDGLSLRQRLEQHRAHEPCKSCHKVMDPIGLSFENYDGVGQYRSQDQFGPIDATGMLPTLQGDVTFNGAAELVPILAKDERLLGCVAQKVLTYAVGRGFTDDDQATLDAVLAAMNASNKGLRGLFASAALSEAFRSRRAVGQ
jgi:hypothetical protein